MSDPAQKGPRPIFKTPALENMLRRPGKYRFKIVQKQSKLGTKKVLKASLVKLCEESCGKFQRAWVNLKQVLA